LVVVIGSGLTTVVSADPAHTDAYFNVSVEGTGSARIHASVFTNSAAPNGITVLAVHGFTETGFTYGPLAGALFADSRLKNRVRRVVAIDMPGHGESSIPAGLPSGKKFGDLTIEDNISVLIQSIDALRSQGLGARVVIGHSMGGLALQGAQESLLAQNSSLSAHGIFGAILLAPVPAQGQQWHENTSSASVLGSYVVTDPQLGSFLSLPDAVSIYGGGFTKLDGTLVANAPTVDQVTNNDYNADEPLTTTFQLVGGVPGALPRPSVRQGAFALRNGTLLAVVSFSQDVLVPAQDLEPLYTYLLGRQGALYRPVTAPDAVHSMFISNPSGLIDGLRDVLMN
jgi:pimeloyl-ACP methyl ester carboxylesterase